MNKTVLITGSTSGIGLAIANVFAKDGYNIMFHGLEANGDNIANEVGGRHKVKVAFSNANLLKAEAVEGLIMQTIKIFGHLHVLVNNAGIQYVS
ncbi:MAG: SDR family NAD(P)-dependent oxidoreductase, partial [Flavobacteriales bacterium]